MSIIYEIALRAGSDVAKAVDDFVESVKKDSGGSEDYDPVRQKLMSDGSTVYVWAGKWNPYKYDVDRRFMKTLADFDEYDGDEQAYRLVAVADESAPDIFYNEAGMECFPDLRPGICYPDEWQEDEAEKRVSGSAGVQMTKERAVDLLRNVVEHEGAAENVSGQIRRLRRMGFGRGDLLFFGFDKADIDAAEC